MVDQGVRALGALWSWVSEEPGKRRKRRFQGSNGSEGLSKGVRWEGYVDRGFRALGVLRAGLSG